MIYEVAIVDDHQLVASALSMMINSFNGFNVSLEVNSGLELQKQMPILSQSIDILLVDVSMPEMCGVQVAMWMNEHYPLVKIAAITFDDTEQTILSMIKAGCCSYLLKNTKPEEFEKALNEIAEKGYYNADATNINYRRLINAEKQAITLTQREQQFLKFACSDDTYKEIAFKMQVSRSTVDGYRDNIFKKLNVENRTGMVLEAVKRGLITLKRLG